jgi:acyl-coenzyme A thioesterase 13
MDPEAVRRTLEPTASAQDISGSTPYDAIVISGVRLDSAEHGRVLCSFVVTPRHAVSRPLPPLRNIFTRLFDSETVTAYGV